MRHLDLLMHILFISLLAQLAIFGCSVGSDPGLISGDADLDVEVEAEMDAQESETEIDSENEPVDGDEDEDTTDADEADLPAVCLEAGERLGYLACLERLVDDAAFDSLAVEDSNNEAVDRLTKYLFPLAEEAPLPVVFQQAERFPLHYDFLRTAFPDLYGGLTPDQYESLILDPGSQQYAAGTLMRFTEPCKGVSYGFSLYQNRADFPAVNSDRISLIQSGLAWLIPGGKVLFVPLSVQDEADVVDWPTDAVEVYDCGEPLAIEVYTAGTAYGTVRRYTNNEFSDATEEGDYGWQDILVIEGAPFDIETVTAAIVTGDRQNALSHVNVRAAIRGTPNLFVRNSLNAFAAYDGMLVKLTVTSGGYVIEADVSLEEARAFWDANRPQLNDVVAPDLNYREFPALDEIPVSAKAERRVAAGRFGGKVSGLAILSGLIDPKYMVDGFAIPFSWYDDFMKENEILAVIDDTPQRMTFRQYVDYWTANENFLSDAATRRSTLNTLVAAMENALNLPTGLEEALANRIETIFGSDTVMVRFRSSSNVEDAIIFNGAGLYESRSVCAADTRRGDDHGSLCDPTRNDPRLITDGLRRVWASFWSPRAFEERLYYKFIKPSASAMGLAVTRAFLDEEANGVAFTGLPQIAGDARMLVNAQVGETSVVSPPPGILPETVLLSVDSESVEIERVTPSSLVTSPAVVMSDAEYSEMGRILAQVRESYPIDAEGLGSDEVVIDLEFKIEPGRQMIFKQARPFLRLSATELPTAFVVDVAEDAALCGQFIQYRDLSTERRLKTRLDLVSGEIRLPLSGEPENLPLISALHFGPHAQELQASGSPHWSVETEDPGLGTVYYRFNFEQAFTSGDMQVTLGWQVLGERNGYRLQPERIELDETAISARNNHWWMNAIVGGQEYPINLSSCSNLELPKYERYAELPSGDILRLDVRWRPEFQGTGAAALVGIEWQRGEWNYSSSDYWSLVYAADLHNWRERFMVVLDEPHDGLGGVIVREPYPFNATEVTVELLDPDLHVLENVAPVTYEIGEPE